LGAIFFTHPFLVYPFDVYTHLGWIDQQELSSGVPKVRETWHYFWASVFHFFSIPKEAIFLRAKIIHYSQFIAIFLILYYVSKSILQHLFFSIEKKSLRYLAYWSTLIWFTIFANYSVHIHQVWIAWYSVNYQITLPLVLLLLALVLNLFFKPAHVVQKFIYLFSILFLSYIVIKVHAMEYLYFLIYLGVLTVVYIDIILKTLLRYWFVTVGLFVLFLLNVSAFMHKIEALVYKKSSLLSYLSSEKFPLLHDEIVKRGTLVVAHYNKSESIMNALIFLSLGTIIAFFLLLSYQYFNNKEIKIRLRLLLFLSISSLFILIPLFTHSAGIASLLTYNTVCYRFYYSALIFLLLPSFIYYVLSTLHIKKNTIFNVALFVTLTATYLYSKYATTHANYYHNIHSIIDMTQKNKMDFNLNQAHIEKIGKQLKAYEEEANNEKPLYYYARDDIAFVLRFIYRKPVLYARRGIKDYHKSYKEDKETTHKAILFETPKGFPSYRRFY